MIIGFGLLFVTIVLICAQAFSAPPILPTPMKDPFAACLEDTQKNVARNKADLKSYVVSWNLCARQLYDNLARDDFAIRREKFRRQELDERVNMWLVVAITLSGVALAALQLFMSYRLALSGKEHWPNESKLAVEHSKISYKTSVTGLAMLALSLAFFGIYVKYIYQQSETGPPLFPPTMFPIGEELPTGVILGPRQLDQNPAATKKQGDAEK